MAITLKSINFSKAPLLGVFAFCLLAGGSFSALAQQSSAAASEIRFQQMEKEIRRLTGQLEEQQYEIRRLREYIDKVQNEMDGVKSSDNAMANSNFPTIEPAETLNKMDRAGVPEKQTGSNKGSFQYNPPVNTTGNQILGTISKSQSSGNITKTGGAVRAYDNAYSFIKSRNFDRAERSFAAFIKNYPEHDLVSNAKYWYGETFYVRGNYDNAARVFAEGYQKYPKGPKAASNLLKLGMSLVGMGKKDDACIAFKQLKKDYSKSSVPVLKRTDSEMAKISCY